MNPRALVVWVGPTEPVRDDVMALLCTSHADRLTVPLGWTLVDERDGPIEFQPSPVAEAPEIEVVEMVEMVEIVEMVEMVEIVEIDVVEPAAEPSGVIEAVAIEPAVIEPAIVEPARVEPMEIVPVAARPHQGLLFGEDDLIEEYEIDLLDEIDEIDEIDQVDEIDIVEYDEAPSWPPVGAFDPDDTGPLPDVSGPLLSRAFRGQGPAAPEATGQP